MYGKNGHIRFNDEAEKREAFDYLISSSDVEFRFEENDKQGAWGPEKRIHFYSKDGVPDCLSRHWTAGTGRVLGRINAGDFYDEVVALRGSR